ncbi:MAG TPA: formimidoylglutamate deiminase [Chthoniobacterales bacterium]|nr:formimidoylglutamate deiminase [Chthoniobacterales bacterium]
MECSLKAHVQKSRQCGSHMSTARLPGLVNVHSHTFQRAIRGRTEHRTAAHDDFWTWREAMYHAATRLSADDIYDVARMAFLEMALSGITHVGEFHYLHHQPNGEPYDDPNLLAQQIIRAAESVGIRLTLLMCAYARAGYNKPPNAGQARFLTQTPELFLQRFEELGAATAGGQAPVRLGVPVRLGLAPHSIRALPFDYIRELVRYAAARKLPLHMHVSEQPGELEQCRTEHGTTPVALLAKHKLLSERFTAVHATHISDDEVQALAAAGATVCACPTTERNLGDGIAPADRLLAAGVPICLGTDSQIQIDLLEDARELEYHTRLQLLRRVVLADNLAKPLFEAATVNGTKSLGGGANDDYFTIDLHDPSIAGAPDEVAAVFSLERTAIRNVFVGGKQIVRGGRHPLQEEIVHRFVEVQERLWR